MMMTKLGCTELQGYYFSRPVDADRMTDLLASYQPKRTEPLLTPVRLVSPRGAADKRSTIRSRIGERFRPTASVEKQRELS